MYGSCQRPGFLLWMPTSQWHPAYPGHLLYTPPIIFNALIENEAVLTRLMFHYNNVAGITKSTSLL